MSLMDNVMKLVTNPKAVVDEARQAVEQIVSDPRAAIDSAVAFVSDPERLQSAVKPVTDVINDANKADKALDTAITVVSLAKLVPGRKASMAHTGAALFALQQLKKLNDKRRDDEGKK